MVKVGRALQSSEKTAVSSQAREPPRATQREILTISGLWPGLAWVREEGGTHHSVAPADDLLWAGRRWGEERRGETERTGNTDHSRPAKPNSVAT